jgi:DNA-directed RNA polymerase specialized sigma24 family protein
MDQHRLRRRILELVARPAEPPAHSMAHAVDEAVSLWPMVDLLPARERATLYLRYRADLSFEQIGLVMGIAPASARTYSSRGTERLRVMLGEERDDE